MSVTSMLLEQAHVIVDVLGWCHDTRGALAPCSGLYLRVRRVISRPSTTLGGSSW